MSQVFDNLLALRERFDADIWSERYYPAALTELRLHCRRVTVQLVAVPSDGELLSSEFQAFTLLRLVWLIKRYIQGYNRFDFLPWYNVHELYALKHALLAYIVCAPPSDWFRWHLGLATDLPYAISVRLHFDGETEIWSTLVHWPMNFVPFKAQQVIRARTGSWPPPEYINPK